MPTLVEPRSSSKSSSEVNPPKMFYKARPVKIQSRPFTSDKRHPVNILIRARKSLKADNLTEQSRYNVANVSSTVCKELSCVGAFCGKVDKNFFFIFMYSVSLYMSRICHI